MKRTTRRLALVAPGGLPDRFRRRPGVRVFESPDRLQTNRWDHVIVLVRWADIEGLAPFIREAGERGRLRSVLLEVETPHQRNLLPAFLHHVRVRSLRNMFLHQGPELPNRVVNAYRIGAEKELIADAAIVGDELFVVTCSGETFGVRFEDLISGDALPARERVWFQVAEDGSHLAWPDRDIHLDLESIRCTADAEYRLRSKYRALSKRRRFGDAVAQLRKVHDLRQSDFDDLSERQVRRIERGESGSLESIRLLAAGHGMTVSGYLKAVAELVSSRPMQVRDSGAGE